MKTLVSLPQGFGEAAAEGRALGQPGEAAWLERDPLAKQRFSPNDL